MTRTITTLVAVILALMCGMILLISYLPQKVPPAMIESPYSQLNQDPDIAAMQLEMTKEVFGEEKKSMSPLDAINYSKRQTAQANLHQLFVLEMSYMAERGEFTENWKALGFRRKTDPYTLSVAWRDEVFEIRAVGNLDKDEFQDILMINEYGEFFILQDDLKNATEKPPVYDSDYINGEFEMPF